MQRGISFVLIDMKSPGATVRPIQMIDGSHEVNELFFDDVRVPAENLSARRIAAGLGHARQRAGSTSPVSGFPRGAFGALRTSPRASIAVASD
ncbi:hypothetical protein [Bradyrhizobium ottawaense]|uniref:hypothetical protein n=1 Tax=Bradyrhizobium ottawaense TaxID=931866 RepID=UPI003F9EE192